MTPNSTLRIPWLCLLFLSLLFAMCSKSDGEPDDEPETKVIPPDPTLAYVLINVAKYDNLNNLIYPTPESFEFRTFPQTTSNLTVTTGGGDTVRCFWMIRPVMVDPDLPFPLYRFCDADYKIGGVDQFSISFYWSKQSNGSTLQAGKMYNLNSFQNSLTDTRGMVIYTHSFNNTLIKQMTTFDYALTKSWIKIDNITDGKASGTFLFGFTCAYPGGTGGSITDVTGKFNKIPIVTM